MRPIQHAVWALGGTKATATFEQIDTWNNVGEALTVERIIGSIAVGTDAGDVGITVGIIHNPSNTFSGTEIEFSTDIDADTDARNVLVQKVAVARSTIDNQNALFTWDIDYRGSRKMSKNDVLGFCIALDNAVSVGYKFSLKILYKLL